MAKKYNTAQRLFDLRREVKIFRARHEELTKQVKGIERIIADFEHEIKQLTAEQDNPNAN